MKFERRVTFLALAAGFPAVALCAFLLWYGSYSGRVQWTVDLFLVIIWLGVAFKPQTTNHPPAADAFKYSRRDSRGRLFHPWSPCRRGRHLAKSCWK